MNEIQLQYVKNVIARQKGQLYQEVTFFMLVKNYYPHKQCEVIWSDEEGNWSSLPAFYHSAINQDEEYWRAHIVFITSIEKSIPGNIKFALRYQVQGKEYWDNNHGLNYSSQADSGVRLAPNYRLLNVGFEANLCEGQKQVLINVAVNRVVNAKVVTIHWTIDNWQHTRTTECVFNTNYWDRHLQSNARNPNQYGIQLWQGLLNMGNAFRLQYSLCCHTDDQVLWDNNYGSYYRACHSAFKVMILNLHCYQEDNQDSKFTQIAKAINEQNIDVVCFQEVAEFWNDGHGDWDTNVAKIINDRLDRPYHLYTDWSHLGFDKYQEGVAILSKYPLLEQDSTYISSSQSIDNIHSRKVVMGQVDVPYFGLLNIYSAHLSWWEDGFFEQFERLNDWVIDKQTKNVKGSLLCGDFNITPGSEGYNLVVKARHYEDQFLLANNHGAIQKIFKVNDPYWQNKYSDDYRIDYIFLIKKSQLEAVSGYVLFTDEDYGRVSDHCGYVVTFEPL